MRKSKALLWVLWVLVALPIAVVAAGLGLFEHAVFSSTAGLGLLSEASVSRFGYWGLCLALLTLPWTGPKALQWARRRAEQVAGAGRVTAARAHQAATKLSVPMGAAAESPLARGKVLKWGGVGLIVLLLWYWYFGEHRPKQRAIAAVSESLVDPESAKFRNVRTVGDAVCGEVNARNRMGGYGGFSPFVYRNGEIAVGAGNSRDLATTAVIERLCSR